MQITPEQYSWTVFAYNLSAFCSSILGTLWLDRFDRKRVLMFTYFFFLIGTIACGLAPSYDGLIAARLFTGIFGGLMGAVASAIVSDTFPVERRATAMSIVMMSFSLASVLGIPFGLWLAEKWDWHAPFLAVAVMGAVNLLLILGQVPSVKGHLANGYDPQTAINLWKSLWQVPIRSLGLACGWMIFFGQFMVISFISPFLVHNLGFQEHQLSYVYITGGAVTVVTSPIIGKLSDRYGKNTLYRYLALISIIPFIVFTNLPTLAIPFVLVVIAIFFIFVNGRTIPAYTIISSVVPPKERGGYLSLYSSIAQLSSGLGVLVAGEILKENPNTREIIHFDWLGYLAVVFTLFSVVMIHRLTRRLKEV
jgi:predicted MFS family arabinose efflux permease